MGKNRETLQSLSLSHRLVHAVARAAQPGRRQTTRQPPRDAVLRRRDAMGPQHRVEGRLHARPLRARRRLFVRAGARHRLRRDDDVLVSHRGAAPRRRQDRRAFRDLEQARAAQRRRAPGDGAPRGSGQRPARRHRIPVGHSAARSRTSRALGRARISGPPRRRRHRVERAHRLHRRRVRRADDRSALPPRRSRSTKH